MPRTAFDQTALAPEIANDPLSHGLSMNLGGPNDILQSIGNFPRRNYGVDPAANQPHYVWTKTDSHWNQAAVLPDTIVDFSITAPITWMPRVFPWLVTNKVHIQWQQFENPAPIMQQAPELTSAETFGQKLRMFRRTLKRFMLAYQVEDGSMQEDFGRSCFVMAMGVIGRSLIDTSVLLGLKALADCQTSVEMLQRAHGYIKDGDLIQHYRREVDLAFTVQKDPRGLINLDFEVDEMQRYWGGEADGWIFGPEIMGFLKNIPLFTEYQYGGQQAVDFLSGQQVGKPGVGQKPALTSLGPAGFINNNVPIFIAQLQHADRSSTKMEVLTNSLEVGLFHLMVDTWSDNTNYKNCYRDIEIFNNDRDAFSQIFFIDALKHLVVWDEATGALDESIWKNKEKGVNVVHKDWDFLSVPVDKSDAAGTAAYPAGRRNITYFGEMNGAFVSKKHFLDMAHTVIRNVTYGDTGEMDTIKKNAREIVADSKKVASDALKNFDQKLERLVGSDNLFYKGTLANPRDPTGGRTTTKGLVANFATAGVFVSTAMRNAKIASQVTPQASAKTAEQVYDTFFNTTMADAFREEKRAKLDEISKRKDLDFAGRYKEAKQYLADIVTNDKGSLAKKFPTVETAHKWSDALYEDAVKLASSSSSAAITSATTTSGPDMISGAIGARAPDGYESLMAGTRYLAAGMPAFSAGYGSRAPPTAVTDDQAKKTEEIRKAAAAIDADRSGSGLKNFAVMIDEILNSDADILVKWVACICAGIVVSRDNCVRLAEGNCRVPLGVILFRPHCGYFTRGAVKVGLDGKTGFMAIGGASYKAGGEAARMTGLVTFACYLSAVVTRHKNVIPIRHIYCAGYAGGMGSAFWKRSEYVQNAARNRRMRSIIAIPADPNFREFDEQFVDARGTFQGDSRRRLVENSKSAQPLYNGAGRICQLLGWHDRGRTNPMEGAIDDLKFEINFICHAGITGHRLKDGQSFGNPTAEQGHFGKNVYEGSGECRRRNIAWDTSKTHYNVARR